MLDMLIRVPSQALTLMLKVYQRGAAKCHVTMTYTGFCGQLRQGRFRCLQLHGLQRTKP